MTTPKPPSSTRLSSLLVLRHVNVAGVCVVLVAKTRITNIMIRGILVAMTCAHEDEINADENQRQCIAVQR